jgi:hypothetical protein
MTRFTGLVVGLGATILAGLVLATSSVAAGSLPALTLTLTKSGVAVGGAKVSGAVNVVTTVKGKVPNPEPALIELDPGVPLSAIAKVKATSRRTTATSITSTATARWCSMPAPRPVPAARRPC